MEKIKELLKKYKIEIFYSEEDNGYIAIVSNVPEFEFMSAFGETPEKALKEIYVALKLAIETRLEDGDPIPEPIQAAKKSA